MYQLVYYEANNTGNIISRSSEKIDIPEVQEKKRFLKTNKTEVLQIDNMYFSYDKSALEGCLDKCISKFLFENTIRAVTAYLNRNNIKFETDVSEYNSYYFKYYQDNIFVKIRVSDHPSRERCATAEIRYDLMSKKSNYAHIRKQVDRILDKAISRKKVYTVYEFLDLTR